MGVLGKSFSFFSFLFVFPFRRGTRARFGKLRYNGMFHITEDVHLIEICIYKSNTSLNKAKKKHHILITQR